MVLGVKLRYGYLMQAICLRPGQLAPLEPPNVPAAARVFLWAFVGAYCYSAHEFEYGIDTICIIVLFSIITIVIS